MLVFVALLGCKEAVEAPANLEEVMVYAFTNYDESDEYLEAAQANLLPLVNAEANAEQLVAGYSIDDLTKADLAAVGVDAQNIAGIVGLMGRVDYRHGLNDVVEAVSAPDKAERWPDNFDSFEVQETTERPCFLSGACDQLDQTVHEIAKLAFPVNSAERTYDVSFRWIQGEDLPPAVFIRQLSPDPVNVGWDAMEIHQQYSLIMLWETEGIAHRVEAFWVDAEFIDIDLEGNYAVKTAVTQMGKQAENIDTWLDEN